jgi:hypothetical protein
MTEVMLNESPVAAGELLRRQTAEGAWGYHVGSQPSVEATCLALLAVGRESHGAALRSVEFLLRTQNPDGSWPAFPGEDREGCWTTALALIALRTLNADASSTARAVNWLTEFKGREGHWLWRWKFRFFDTKVRFDPGKFGWPWIADTVSWVIPTAFALIALKKAHPSSIPGPVSMRIERSIEMLRDRMCPGGGWNAGNSEVFGVPLDPYIDATAIALLALRATEGTREVAMSLEWLSAAASSYPSPHGLSWAILALASFRADVSALVEKLDSSLRASWEGLDTATLAVAALALDPFVRTTAFGTTL